MIPVLLYVTDANSKQLVPPKDFILMILSEEGIHTLCITIALLICLTLYLTIG